MIYLEYKIVDIYNFVVTKKSWLRENIRYEFYFNCEKSTKRVEKCSGYAEHEELRGILSKWAVFEKKKQQ